MRLLLTITGLAILTLALVACCKETPVRQHLADCTNSRLRFQMKVQESPPYQFVLGMPQGVTSRLSFQGEIKVSQPTGTVALVKIGSDAITPCNWLSGLSGYILTWERTNRIDRLESFLKRGQSYEVELRFSEQPPPGSSIWLSEMGTVGF